MENKSEEPVKELEIVKSDKPVLVNTETTNNEDWKPTPPIKESKEKTISEEKETEKIPEKQNKQNEIKAIDTPQENNIKLNVEEKESKLSFNDNDSVLDLGTNKESIVQAPKTPERLDKIAKEQHEKRKAEEAEEEEEEKLTIFDSVDLKLDSLDINNLDKKLDTRPDPVLNDIEILS